MKVKKGGEVGSRGASRTRKWLCWQRWQENTAPKRSVWVGLGTVFPRTARGGCCHLEMGPFTWRVLSVLGGIAQKPPPGELCCGSKVSSGSERLSLLACACIGWHSSVGSHRVGLSASPGAALVFLDIEEAHKIYQPSSANHVVRFTDIKLLHSHGSP